MEKVKQLVISLLYVFMTMVIETVIYFIFILLYARSIIDKQGGNEIFSPGELQRMLTSQELQNFMYSNTQIIVILRCIIAVLIFLLIYKLGHRSLTKEIRLRKISGKLFLVMLGAGIGFTWFLNGILTLTNIQSLFPEYTEIIEAIMNGPQILIFIGVVIAAPIFEEILYRGVIYSKLRKAYSVTLAIILQALIFGAAHLNWLQSMYAFVMGLVLGLFVYWTGSLICSIIIHMIFNLIGFLASLIPVTEQIENASISSGFVTMLSSIIMTIVGAIIIYYTSRYAKKNKEMMGKDQ